MRQSRYSSLLCTAIPLFLRGVGVDVPCFHLGIALYVPGCFHALTSGYELRRSAHELYFVHELRHKPHEKCILAFRVCI